MTDVWTTRDTRHRRGRRPAGTSRRNVLALGALGAIGLAGAGLGLGLTDLTKRAGPVAMGGAGRTPVSARPSATAPSPTPDLLAAARTRLDRYVAQVGGRVSVALHDLVTGARLTVNPRRFQTASIVKVDILAALLLDRQRAGERLTATQRGQATRMITVSDNDAASRLFRTIGGARGLTDANEALGLTETRPDSAWGVTTTTAADQIRLLRAICADNGPLSPASREFVLGLMAGVVDEQRWGVPSAALSAGTGVWVKNGWDQISVDRNLWLVNSIGRITEQRHDWLIAILSDHHATWDKGIEVVEVTARLALETLRAT